MSIEITDVERRAGLVIVDVAVVPPDDPFAYRPETHPLDPEASPFAHDLAEDAVRGTTQAVSNAQAVARCLCLALDESHLPTAIAAMEILLSLDVRPIRELLKDIAQGDAERRVAFDAMLAALKGFVAVPPDRRGIGYLGLYEAAEKAIAAAS